MLRISQLLLLCLAFSSVAFADSPLDHYYADMYTSFYGPTLGSVSNQSVSMHGVQDTADPISFDNEITLAYLLDVGHQIGIGPDIRFYYNPSSLSPKTFTNNDWAIKAFDKKTIDQDGLRVATNLLLQAPTSDSSRNRSMKWALKTTPYVWYYLGKSSFKVGTWTEFKFYDGVTAGKNWKLYAEPYISYDVSSKFAWILGYEMEYDHILGGNGFIATERDIQPGFAFSLTKAIYVNPYLQIFPFDTVSWRSTGIAVFMGFKFL